MSIRSCSPLSLQGKENYLLNAGPTFSALVAPLEAQLPHLTPLESGSNRSLTYTFSYQVRGLVYYHIEAFSSAQDLLTAARCDPFVNHLLVPKEGLGESTFYEANATRGSLQMLELVERLFQAAALYLPFNYPQLGSLVAIDGSFLPACLSMAWADYSAGVRKAKVHLGFNLNQGIPRKLFLSAGRGAERPFVSLLLEPQQTGVVDRGYENHALFDTWIKDKKHFVARVRKDCRFVLVQPLTFLEGSSIFFFGKVLLGDDSHRMTHPIFLVGFKSRGQTYWIATDRQDLSAEQIALIYSLRWKIEIFFGWWKRHLKVYHLISRNPHGVLLQMLSGLITYLLLVIYFHQCYAKPPSVERLRQLRWDIRHDSKAAIRLHIYISSPFYPITPSDRQWLWLLSLLCLWGNPPAIL